MVDIDGTGQVVQSNQRNILARAITGPLLFMFILGDVLGAGIYALVGVIAGEKSGEPSGCRSW